ncbi:hypothetical protein niasHT_018488 [Heterodera trifolii]|uniref:Uncharacterized protein n=1 Tax=Heterodera trifolii TaxID=157864 RepID=A0ABD2KTY5_9BILA
MRLRQLLLIFVPSLLFGRLCGSKPSKFERSKNVTHRRAPAPPPTQIRRSNSTPKKGRNPSKNRANFAEHPSALSRQLTARKQCFDDTIDFLNNRSSSSLGRHRSLKGRKSDANGNLWAEFEAGRVTKFPLEEYHTPITEYLDRTRANLVTNKESMRLRDVLLIFVASFLFGHSFGGLCGSKPVEFERSKSAPHRRAPAHPSELKERAHSARYNINDTIDLMNNKRSSSFKSQSSSKGRKSDAKEPSQKRHSLKSQMMLDRINDHQGMTKHSRQSAGYRNSYGTDSSYRTSYGIDGTPTSTRSSNSFGNGTPRSSDAYDRNIKKQNRKKQAERERDHNMDQLWTIFAQGEIPPNPPKEEEWREEWIEHWNDNRSHYD